MVGENRIKTLNQKHRKIDKPTDVLSFPIIEKFKTQNVKCKIVEDSIYDPRTKSYQLKAISYPLALGSVVICPKVAKINDESIIDLVVHGLIHLIGYDHEKDGDNDQFCKISEEFWTRFSRR